MDDEERAAVETPEEMFAELEVTMTVEPNDQFAEVEVTCLDDILVWEEEVFSISDVLTDVAIQSTDAGEFD